MDISDNKTNHTSQNGNSLIPSQRHHPSKEIKSKQIKENRSREICDKSKEFKKLDYNHKYRNTVNKKAVSIIGNSILNGINQRGFSNESFKVRVKKSSRSNNREYMRPFKARNPKET